MRFIVKAIKDSPPDYADRSFTKDGKPLKKGDEIELSGAGYELVTEGGAYHKHFGELFELVRELPQSPEEAERAKARLLKAELMEESKADLVKEAEKLGIDAAQNKEPLAAAIAEAKTESEKPADVFLTASDGTINPKVKRGNN